jgi:DNA processing protein
VSAAGAPLPPQDPALPAGEARASSTTAGADEARVGAGAGVGAGSDEAWWTGPRAGDRDLPPVGYAVALAGLPRMGPARLTAVLGAAASPRDAWDKVRRGERWDDPGVVAALGASWRHVLAGWRAAAATVDVGAGWRRLGELGVGAAQLGEPGYPAALVADVEPPAVVFFLGRPAVVDGPRVAIVGTRRCTASGAGVAYELGRDLAAAGVAVVSGLADGIDAAAHRGALAAGSAAAPPVGVVGNGFDTVYPPSQRALWHAVAEAGVLLGEAPLGAPPERWRFPARNRIIAALADVVVVVESHRRGGSMHTVDEADRRSVDVMAVPGSVRNPAAAGTNDLLAEGRAPVRDAGDVLVALGLARTSGAPAVEPPPDPRPEPSGVDRKVLDAVGWQAASLDQLALRAGLDLPGLACALDRLRAAGWVAQDGGWYVRITPGAS